MTGLRVARLFVRVSRVLVDLFVLRELSCKFDHTVSIVRSKNECMQAIRAEIVAA